MPPGAKLRTKRKSKVLRSSDMKAFMIGMAALVAITVVAAVGLGAIDMSAEQIYSSTSGNVRL